MKKLKKTKIFIFGKKSHNAEKKLKGGPFGVFQHPFCRKTSKKMQGGPFGENFFFEKKVSQCRKNERGESLVSPGMVCYAEKQEKPFWFSSLDQIVHFDAIIFCRTFVELFWSVHVDRKKRVTIIVAFHFMKRRLKNQRGDPLASFGIVGYVKKLKNERGIIFFSLHVLQCFLSMILTSVPCIMVCNDLGKGTMDNHDLSRFTMIMARVLWLRTL